MTDFLLVWFLTSHASETRPLVLQVVLAGGSGRWAFPPAPGASGCAVSVRCCEKRSEWRRRSDQEVSHRLWTPPPAFSCVFKVPGPLRGVWAREAGLMCTVLLL